MENVVNLRIDSNLQNVAIVRVVVASILSNLNITIDELSDIKTAVSEAVTNSIEHGYEKTSGKVDVEVKLANIDNMPYINIKVEDYGVGIEDIELATTPSYTSKPELEHAGLGFTVMETFMDEVIIDSEVGKGTAITMVKRIRSIKN
jgi:stage II sporulation protein AB (anti-sigma F factor)